MNMNQQIYLHKVDAADICDVGLSASHFLK